MWKLVLFTLGGCVLGGIAGHFLSVYLANQQSMVGYAIPGALAALGAGFNKRCPSVWVAIACGVFAFLLGNFTLWKISPWAVDHGYWHGLTRFFDRGIMVVILIPLASLIAFWIPWRRTPRRRRRPPPESSPGEES